MFICLDLGGTHLRGACFSQGKLGPVLLTEHGQSLSGLKQALLEMIETLARGKEIKALGIASAGPFLRKARVFLTPPNLPYLQGFAVGKFLAEHFHFPLLLENDAQAAALGEVHFGCLKGAQNALVLTLGTGLGSGIVLKGKLFRANLETGPELGHLFWGGLDRCGCGKRGCIETLLQARALLNLASKEGLNLAQVKDLTPLLEKKEPRAWRVMKGYGQTLGTFLAEMVQLFGFEDIALSGGISYLGKYFLPFVQETLENRLKSRVELKPRRLVLSENPEQSGLWGMAYLLTKTFNPEE
jgi:glucokinase